MKKINYLELSHTVILINDITIDLANNCVNRYGQWVLCLNKSYISTGFTSWWKNMTSEGTKR